MAAQMAQKVQHPPPTEDGARDAAQAQEWLNEWEKRSTSMDAFMPVLELNESRQWTTRFRCFTVPQSHADYLTS
jgi:hypothetical protein